MDVRRLSPVEAVESAVRALGLGQAGVDLLSPEALAVSLRRAASLLCPATPRRIVQSVVDALSGFPGYTLETRDQLESMLETLIAYGDVLELPTDATDTGGRRIFLGAPAFVRRASGACLLVGVRPDGVPLVGDELSSLIEYEGHVRLIRPAGPFVPVHMLTSARLLDLGVDQWLKAPRVTSANDLIEEYQRRLQAAGPSGDIADLTLVDPSTSVTYYRGRWRPPRKTDDGSFVARRPQAFGADLWCFAQLSHGQVVKLVDLPVGVAVAPAADEAWRLQAALDALAGQPQRARVRVGPRPGSLVLDVFSPLPSWAQRRLDVIGTPLLRSRGALLSYGVPHDEVDEECLFLREMLWMTTDSPEGSHDDG